VLPAGDAVRPQQRLRQVLYRAYVTRASDQAEGDAIKFDNSALIREILALRQEEARLLGYVNFGEVSVVPKMAESPQQVITSCATWPARPAPMPSATWPTCAPLPPSTWACRPAGLGLALHQRKAQGSALRLQRAGRQAVLHRAQGAGRSVQDHRDAVRGVDPPDTAPVWHPSVQFYRIERTHLEGAHKGTQLVGQFYLDQPARNGKRGGAWMDDVRTRWLRPDTGPCRPRWRTWCATLPTAWMASRRC
jgi:oligopeptidase A